MYNTISSFLLVTNGHIFVKPAQGSGVIPSYIESHGGALSYIQYTVLQLA